MPISNSAKGVQSIKSMRNSGKSAIPNKEDSDFIKLYVFEKERVRLKTEEIRILQRLDIIRTRLKEIHSFTKGQVEQLQEADPDSEPKRKNTSNKILEQASIDKDTRIKNLSTDDLNKLRNVIEKSYKIEGDLRREVLLNIKRLKEIKSYRGSRHTKGLPARGQRTKTNSRTRRGNKRGLATSGKKPTNLKT